MMLADTVLSGQVLILMLDEAKGQITEYDEGVGNGIFKYLGGATCLGLSKNIKDCYDFLVDHFQTGDRIYLFGYSRGAYTVRSLAGLIYRCGVLKKQHKDNLKPSPVVKERSSHTTT